MIDISFNLVAPPKTTSSFLRSAKELIQSTDSTSSGDGGKINDCVLSELNPSI
jgi:hypothetical protein